MTEKKTVSAYERVQMARKQDRPLITDYINNLFDDFIELKGDRLFREDSSILGGIALFHGIPVTVIGHKKGRNIEDNVLCNFGMPSPEGYRKAIRLMQQAEKFNRPVITFVDTPGAYPGIEAEANGQSNAIAESIALMTELRIPTISIITGEGSSGGALALASSDRVFMLENAVYSILSPEGFSSILYKDSHRASEAAELMKITAEELLEYELIDGIIPEGKNCIKTIDKMLKSELGRLVPMSKSMLVNSRYKKIRNFGKQYCGK